MLKKILTSTSIIAVAAASLVIGLAADRVITISGRTAFKTEMLNPTVRVTAVMKEGTARGSGTVVHSGADGTFILTNHHVVDDLIKEHVDGEPPVEVQIEDWVFLPGHRYAMPTSVRATIASDDPADDLTLLRVTDPEYRAESVADVMSPADHVEMGEPVFAVGGGVGERPFATQGLVSLTDIVDRGRLSGRMLISAPIIGGNSGGGAYVLHSGHYEFVGVPSALEVAHDAAVPHMALVIPMSVVRPFLVQAGLTEYRDTTRGHKARALLAAAF